MNKKGQQVIRRPGLLQIITQPKQMARMTQAATGRPSRKNTDREIFNCRTITVGKNEQYGDEMRNCGSQGHADNAVPFDQDDAQDKLTAASRSFK